MNTKTDIEKKIDEDLKRLEDIEKRLNSIQQNIDDMDKTLEEMSLITDILLKRPSV
ncbi:MAG: hypothetical protein IJX15_07675 [Ruminiclostridium sp.]|nr:hypothetical protein [Ruminiclostridium sp.]